MSTEDGRRPRIVLGLILFFALITIVTVAMFAMPWRSEVASEEGKGIDSVITYLLFATGGLVILGHVVLIKFLWGGRGDLPALVGRWGDSISETGGRSVSNNHARDGDPLRLLLSVRLIFQCRYAGDGFDRELPA